MSMGQSAIVSGYTLIDIETWVPSFLEGGISILKSVASNGLKKLHKEYDEFESYCWGIPTSEGVYQSHSTEYKQLKKLQRDCDADDKKVFKLEQSIQSLETELKILKSGNEKIQDDIYSLSEDLKTLGLLGKQLAKEREETNWSRKRMLEEYLLGKKFYKKNLLCHIRLHKPAENPSHISNPVQGHTLTFSYLIDDVKVLEVKLYKEDDSWKVLDVQPFIPAAVEIQKQLHETGDIRDFLCLLREEAFKLSTRVK